jgi:tRNA A37 threonylcarbamoyladenosine dehydratase
MLLGKKGIERLWQASVAVFGIGGVGGHAAETLVRSGLGKITLFDDDTVCETNINRQIIATHATVGQPKTAVMRDRLLEISPKAGITAVRCFYGAETDIELSAFDYIVDAIDTVTSKLLLAERAAAAGVPIISCMGTGNKLDPTRLEVADIFKTEVCPLAKVMRKELRARGIKSLKTVYSKEPPLAPFAEDINDCRFNCICPPENARHCEKRRHVPGSVAFVPPVAGIIIAGEVIKDLIFGNNSG